VAHSELLILLLEKGEPITEETRRALRNLAVNRHWDRGPERNLIGKRREGLTRKQPRTSRIRREACARMEGAR